MPYKLRITNEEVENELKKLGLTDLTEEMIEEFRKDLLKLIKNDLRMLKKMKKEKELKLQSEEERFKREIKFSTTSTPSSFLEQELEKEKVRRHKEKKDRRESESRSATTSEATSKQASSLSSESSSQDSEMEVIKREKDKKPVTTSVSVRKKEKPPILKEPKSGNKNKFYEMNMSCSFPYHLIFGHALTRMKVSLVCPVTGLTRSFVRKSAT